MVGLGVEELIARAARCDLPGIYAPLDHLCLFLDNLHSYALDDQVQYFHCKVRRHQPPLWGLRCKAVRAWPAACFRPGKDPPIRGRADRSPRAPQPARPRPIRPDSGGRRAVPHQRATP